MTYHPLTSDSGSDAARRVEEARDLCRMLADLTEQMEPQHRKMIEDMTDNLESLCNASCTTPQLFFLRDIRDRYLG